MEVPAMDDNMEMASPYQGHADDFEIDIDLMEDQASNPDRDMTATDEYMDNSHDTNYPHDGSPDEDMVDDAAEPSMIDADDYRETNQTVEMQYEEDQTYEAEMLEDEYDEDIDAPVPVQQQETEEQQKYDNATHENSAVSPARIDEDLHADSKNISAGPFPESEPETANKSPESRLDAEWTVGSPDGQRPAEEPVEISETSRLDPGNSESQEAATNTNNTEQADIVPAYDNNLQDITEEPPKLENEGEDSHEIQPSIDENKEAQIESHEERQTDESNAHEAEQNVEQEAVEEVAEGRETADHPPLHPVKVYYQDMEISLFPPREGDSSETFFLGDEGLAYESFGKLFESCREVLHDHINDNEVLVIDIEALNLQLIEDSLETNNVTLKLIVDVYLQLCHNDGDDKPEALYLTLSTKLTVAAELSDLLLAASEGKGLSEIQSWEACPEGEGASVDLEEVDQESYSKETQDAVDNESNQADSDQRDLQSSSNDQNISNSLQDNAEFQENHSIQNVATENLAINTGETEAQNVVSPPQEPPHATSHDSEEQKTDSTGTLEFSTPRNETAHQPELGEIAEDSHGAENSEDEYYEDGEIDEEAHPEEEFYVDEGENIDDLGQYETHDTADITEGHLDEYHDLESEYYEQPLSEENIANDASHDNQEVIANEIQPQDNSKATNALLERSTSTSQSHQTLSLANDSLGSAGDLLESSGNNSRTVEQQSVGGDASEPGEINENTELSSHAPANDDETHDLPFGDEEDYLDLATTEDLGDLDTPATPSQVSTKRSREVDDDLDLPGSTTSEVKRSRSS
ncbi:hypothetical protein BJX99DRAFT_253086 [Aspergillus californicus]